MTLPELMTINFFDEFHEPSESSGLVQQRKVRVIPTRFFRYWMGKKECRFDSKYERVVFQKRQNVPMVMITNKLTVRKRRARSVQGSLGCPSNIKGLEEGRVIYTLWG